MCVSYEVEWGSHVIEAEYLHQCKYKRQEETGSVVKLSKVAESQLQAPNYDDKYALEFKMQWIRPEGQQALYPIKSVACLHFLHE